MKLYIFCPRTNKKQNEKDDIFELLDDDRYAIEIAKKTARRFLMLPGITPRQIIGLGNALYSLERMPLTTPGVSSEFSITKKMGNDTLSEMRYIAFRISDSDFEINTGGSVSNFFIRSDTFEGPEYYIATGGYSEMECGLSDIEEKIEEYFLLGAEIFVNDESKIEYEMIDEK